jgi:hypothetical protein
MAKIHKNKLKGIISMILSLLKKILSLLMKIAASLVIKYSLRSFWVNLQ